MRNWSGDRRPLGSVIGLGVLAVVVGTVSERVFGTARWKALFVAGALTGHGIGELWQPYGSAIPVGFAVRSARL